jgi:Flp pilus assembly protein TadG
MARTLISLIVRFRRDNRGASAIEFVILAPALIMMLLGVMQIGLYMQAQNALSGVAGDMSRYMSVEYQKDNKITNTQLETLAYARATGAPYLLDGAKLATTATNSATQPIANVREIELKLNYKVPSVMAFANMGPLQLTYTKSIFVANG